MYKLSEVDLAEAVAILVKRGQMPLMGKEEKETAQG